MNGGVTEEYKAKELGQFLNAEVQPIQVVLSHSPMKALTAKYRDSGVLILGQDACKDVALSYGFRKPVTADEVMLWNPSMWPFRDLPLDTKPGLLNFDEEPIKAIFMFHDSRDWGRDLQLCSDILRSRDGFLGTVTERRDKQSVPIYFSNSDFLWSNDYPVNRYAQGAFRMALEHLYKQLTGLDLQYTKYGKPEHATYRFALQSLEEHAESLWPNVHPMDRRVYAVGDNPAS
ncbi:hypothetical protein HK104_007922, partial [Borealophlyctis nickersoniae]